MPDVTVLPTGGMQGGGGGPNWLLIGGLGAGVIALVLVMGRNGGSAGQPTTAAGTSINAALGSIQEQNLNVMGEVSAGNARINNELGAVNNNVIVGNQMSTWIENQVAFAASEQATNPTDAAARLQAAFQAWLSGLQGNTDGTASGGYQALPLQ